MSSFLNHFCKLLKVSTFIDYEFPVSKQVTPPPPTPEMSKYQWETVLYIITFNVIKQICKTFFLKEDCGEEFINTVLNFGTKYLKSKLVTTYCKNCIFCWFILQQGVAESL